MSLGTEEGGASEAQGSLFGTQGAGMDGGEERGQEGGWKSRYLAKGKVGKRAFL